MGVIYTSLKITAKFNKVLDRIKKETGSSKLFIVQKAVEEYYKDILEKIDKKER